MQVILATLAVLVIIYMVPLVVYGVASALWDLKPDQSYRRRSTLRPRRS